MSSINSIARTIHLLLCKQDHQKECLWYIEEQQAECWEMKEHKKWLNKAEGVINLSNYSIEKVEQLLRSLINLTGEISNIKNSYFELTDFIDVILFEEKSVY